SGRGGCASSSTAVSALNSAASWSGKTADLARPNRCIACTPLPAGHIHMRFPQFAAGVHSLYSAATSSIYRYPRLRVRHEMNFDIDLEQINHQLKDSTPEEIVRWALGLGKRTLTTTSFSP